MFDEISKKAFNEKTHDGVWARSVSCGDFGCNMPVGDNVSIEIEDKYTPNASIEDCSYKSKSKFYLSVFIRMLKALRIAQNGRP